MNTHAFFTKLTLVLTLTFVFTLGSLILLTPEAVLADGPIYVDKDAPGPIHDGLSWTTAFTHPQTALDTAGPGDEIWVAAGIYTPTHILSGSGEPTFFMRSNVALYGGFAGNETERSARNWNLHLTILSGDMEGNDITDVNGIITDTDNITGTNAKSVVYSGPDVTSTTVLDGFIITGGHGGLYGGGVRCEGNPIMSYSSLTLNNLTIIGNQASSGGGMYTAEFVSQVLSSVHFTRNYASSGGGIFNGEGNSGLKLHDVTFYANYASSGGGGILNAGGDIQLQNVTFEKNESGTTGGGIQTRRTTILTQTHFISNTAGTHGGGMYCDTNAVISLAHVTFISNTAESGGGLYQYRNRVPDFHNVSFVANRASQYGGGVYLHAYAEALSAADTITFTGNHAGSHGGGLYADIDYSLTNATFEDNTATQNGGAIYLAQDAYQFELTGAHLKHNTAQYGGAVYQRYGTATFVSANFSNNTAEQEGGALYSYNGNNTSIISDSTFSLNSAQGGGALYIVGTTHITSSTFSNNQATSGAGGGAQLLSEATLFDVTFNGNTGRDGGALSLDDAAQLTQVTFNDNEVTRDGGGLIKSGTSDVTLNDVTFNRNIADSYGGGLYGDAGLSLQSVRFYSNTAGYGGGMATPGEGTSDPMLTDVIFGENSAVEGGGLYHRDYKSLTVNNALFYGNTADRGGGLFSEGTLQGNNLVFSGNTSSSEGGGLYLQQNDATLTNLSVFNNTAYDGGGLYAYSGNVTLRNAILWGNHADGEGAQLYVSGGSATLNDDLVQGGCPAGATCANILDADPQPVRHPDPGDYDWSTLEDNDYGDLRLRPTSPAIDAGDDSAVTLATDIDGNPRIMGAAVDLGAYEVEVYTLTMPVANTVYDFAPNVCGSVIFSSTGTLPTSLVVTLTHAHPTAMGDGLPRRYDIAASGGSGYVATLTLCYEDDELVSAGIPADQETNLHLYRWDPSTWVAYSEVNTTTNRITAGNVTAFGTWGIGTTGAHPTSVRMSRATTRSGVAYAGLLLLGLCAILTVKLWDKGYKKEE